MDSLSLPRKLCSSHSTPTPLRTRRCTIRVNGQSIFASKEVKYLGVHFTRWGRTNQQVAHNARNASRALNVIKVVSAQPWANTPKIPVNVVRALVRSRLSYGLEFNAPPLENGSSPSHRHRGSRSATGPRAAAVRAAVPGVQRGRAPPVPPPHPARL